ncbi:frizzled-6 [Microtus ochrogaster]|uniref:Frizzled-6 n=1 Tax=Microtus ochrogaster TaxID=79684 RepID=A0ABM1UTB8_MICOH|nr:frizzled-6 [Microtus ochrogaster]XP_026645227.1 frizzled-6 [Microtus ochrogaster]XP_026645228.1 frizzled-6 [Microtus ochrogaster]XP_026645229.1 frizzled-6 [Microtus ochrogaster]XP_026645230.1 frizzled-6 [Microtus ochrogaster]
MEMAPFLLLGLFLPLVRGHSLFTCEPITVPRCMKMAYNMTFFPNLMGHYDQGAAAVEMEHFLPVANLECSPNVELFLCQAFVPTCTEQIHVVPPCRKLCEKVYSDCKSLIDTFGIRWPEELECNRLPPCDDAAPVTPHPHTELAGPQRKTEQVPRDIGFWCPKHLKASGEQGYKFLGIDQCAPPCPNMYFKSDELDFAKSFIGIVSIFCLCATLFTFLTFLIDVRRFRYPERPIIYYSVCYSIVSLMYFVGFLLGNSTACNKADEKLELGDTVVLGSKNKACSVVFMFLYFFTMAGTVWWVILTITWFLAAGRKWSCEAIEQKAVWFHAVAWGMPGFLTVMLLAMNKVEGDNISGVCFVGLYDLDASRYFVLLPLCLCVFVGLSLLLAGIISLNHVRQVIQHDGRNQEKLKKFMIRIGVFSGLYLVPLVTLLGCYVYELVNRITWEITWFSDHCRQYRIPCPYQANPKARPELALFMIKYLMTLIVGISAVFWVGSKKTCTEWAGFFRRNRKRDPISESRRVLQESCEFFLKHNSKVKHKKKHGKPGTHKLKVISKSMGTSTGGTADHCTSAMAIADHDYLGQETSTEIQTSPEASVKEARADRANTPRAKDQDCGEPASLAASSSKLPVEQNDRKGRAGSVKEKSVVSEGAPSEGRVSPKNDVTETGPVKCNSWQVPSSSEASSLKGSASLLVRSASGVRKEQGAAAHSDT